MALVIIGGGIVGLSIAYYTSLAQPTRKIIIIDSEKELLLSASGFSGGYIVRDWFSPEVLPLAELSYRLHKDLARQNEGRHLWGYSESIAYSAVIEEVNGTGKQVRGEDWLLTGTSRAEVARKYAAVPQPPSLGLSSPLNATGVTKLSHAKSNEIDHQLGPPGPSPTSSMLRPDGSPAWANIPMGGKLEQISSPDGCAQLEPRQFCEWLLQQCRTSGVEILLDSNVVGFVRDHRGRMAGLFVEREFSSSRTDRKPKNVNLIPCKDVVIAAGSWTPRVYRNLVKRDLEIGIKSLPGYSIVVRSPRYDRPIARADNKGAFSEISHAVFYPPCPPGWTKYSPEAMARMTRNGKPEIFVAGLNDESLPLPRTAGDIKHLMDPAKMQDLKKTAIMLTGKCIGTPGKEASFEDDFEIVREGLCYRPVSTSGRPIISKVSDVETSSPGGGLYIAGGHGPWGITLSLGTGLVVSEMLQGRPTSVSMEPFRLPLPPKSPVLSARL